VCVEWQKVCYLELASYSNQIWKHLPSQNREPDNSPSFYHWTHSNGFPEEETKKWNENDWENHGWDSVMVHNVTLSESLNLPTLSQGNHSTIFLSSPTD
jgi:hypothetical protein